MADDLSSKVQYLFHLLITIHHDEVIFGDHAQTVLFTQLGFDVLNVIINVKGQKYIL